MQRFNGRAEASGIVVTGGLNATNTADLTYASATVTVNIHGGGLATIFSDNLGTPLANPFTANSDATFSFYAANGRYDVVVSGSGVPTITISDVLLFDSTLITGQINALSFSATPVFSAALFSGFTMTLIGNVTSSTLSGGVTGQLATLMLTQGAGGPWTFAWPANVANPPTLTPTAGKTETFILQLEPDGLWHVIGMGEYPFNQINAITGSGGVAVLQASPVINTPTITSPVITGAITGGASAVLGAATVTSLTDSGTASITGNTTVGGTLGVTGLTTLGSLLAKNFVNIRIAAQFAGSDWCAKVTAADTDLGSNAGEIWLDQSANSGACAAAPTLSANHLLRITQGGVYAISVGWTQNNAGGWGIVGSPGVFTFISFTGASGFTADGSSFGNDMQNVTIKDVVFSGNAAIANAATFHNLARCTFENVYGANATTNALWFRGVIASTFKRTGSSVNILTGQAITYTTFPTNFVNFDANAGATSASIGNSGDIVAECGGNAKTGVAFTDIVGNVLAVLTAEGCSVGVSIGGAGFGNTLLLADIEQNTTHDLELDGFRNRITIRSTSNIASAINITGNDNWLSGEAQNVVIGAAVQGTHFESFSYSVAVAGGTITDNSSPNSTSKLKVRNANTGVYDLDLGPNEQVGQLQFSLHSANAGEHNWCLVPGQSGLGFFEIWKGTNSSNNCIGGAAVFQFDASSNLNIIGSNLNSTLGFKNNGSLFISATAPTIAAAGCGGSAATIANNNGTAAFEINVGTAPGSACTVTMPAAAHGWSCSAVDVTTNSTSVFVQKQSPAASQTTTQIVITNFNDVAVATAFTASDVVRVSCHGY